MKAFRIYAICYGILTIAVFMYAGCNRPTPGPVPSPQPAPDVSQAPGQLLVAHNSQRASRNLAPFALSEQLVQAAQNHANHMAKRGQMAHQGIGDGTPWTRIAATGYQMGAGGENVAWNQQNVAQVMNAWMNSPGHRSNILGNFTQFGGAVAYGARNDPYWCTVFATPSGQRVFATSDLPPEGTLEPIYPGEHGYLVAPANFGNQ